MDENQNPYRAPERLNESKNRRWFHVKPSTALILVAIAAWGMTYWPILTIHAGFPSPKTAEYFNPYDEFIGDSWAVRFNTRIFWPALALAAFFTWKAAWAVVERRRRRAAAPE
jgi:hypothetical protein